jgi:hypothetical protein
MIGSTMRKPKRRITTVMTTKEMVADMKTMASQIFISILTTHTNKKTGLKPRAEE